MGNNVFKRKPFEVYDTKTLLETFGSEKIITGIKGSHMTRQYSKPGKLSNVNNANGRTANVNI